MMHQLTAPPGEAGRFLGFTRPTTTPIPDQVIDDWLPLLSGAELKVILYISRRTLGFQKLSDNISLHQLLFGVVKKNGERLDAGTGLSKPTLLQALRDLQAKGIIATIHRSSTERGDEATNYRLCFVEGVVPLVCRPGAPEPAPLQTVGWRRPDYTPRGQESLPGERQKNLTRGEAKKSRPQQTEIQETEKQETDARAITEVINNTSDGSPIFGVGVLSDETFWSAANQVDEPRLEVDADTDASLVTISPSPSSDAPPSPTIERRQIGASALIALGMTAKVAYRLAEHYSLARIEEKLSYLDFLQQDQPDKVKNPCGWLRTAIEDDFAAPDGFVSPAEREQRAAERARRAEAELVQAQEAEMAAQQAQAQKAAHAQAYQVWLHDTYGTAERERTFWAQALPELACALPAHKELVQRSLQPAQILQVSDTEVVLGFADEALARPLTHPGIQKRIEHTLSAVAGRTVQVRYEVIPPMP